MLSSFETPTLKEILTDQCRFRPSFGPGTGRLMEKCKEAHQRVESVASELRPLFDVLGIDQPLTVPQELVYADIGAMDVEDARERLEERHERLVSGLEQQVLAGLERGARAQRIGRIEWLGPKACRFHYFDDVRTRTLMQITTRTIRHTHDLVDAKKIRLPASEVQKPRRCQQIISALPAWMRKWTFIVVGTQIVADVQQVARRDDPSEVALAIESAKNASRRAGRFVADHAGQAAAGAVAVGALASGMAVGMFLAPLMTVLSDPALVIGEYVLTGWE